MKLQFVEEEFYKFIRQFEESTYIIAYLERKINHMNFGEDDGRVGIFLRRIVLKTPHTRFLAVSDVFLSLNERLEKNYEVKVF